MTDTSSESSIIHFDMDAFYASVEVLDNPSLRGKPVIVGGGTQRGVVSSASYEARSFGVHSAQSIAAARRLCPHGVFLPPRMARYRAVSDRVFAIFDRFTPLVEPLSLDEAFLDVTGSLHLFGPAEKIAKDIKALVRAETGLTVSAGIGPLKFIAKIASEMQKPDGLTIVLPHEVADFLEPLPVERLWGVGDVTAQALHSLGVCTIGDLSRVPPQVLAAKFGAAGVHLHRLSLGIDERRVEPAHEAKSMGREETFSEDLVAVDLLRKEVLSLAFSVARNLRRARVSGTTVTLKVKYHDFVLSSRSLTLPHPTDDGDEIFHACSRLLEKTEAGRKPVRLLGVTLSRLCHDGSHWQRSLFSALPVPEKRRKLNAALDAIQERFGEEAIFPGSLLKK